MQGEKNKKINVKGVFELRGIVSICCLICLRAKSHQNNEDWYAPAFEMLQSSPWIFLPLKAIYSASWGQFNSTSLRVCHRKITHLNCIFGRVIYRANSLKDDIDFSVGHLKY